MAEIYLIGCIDILQQDIEPHLKNNLLYGKKIQIYILILTGLIIKNLPFGFIK